MFNTATMAVKAGKGGTGPLDFVGGAGGDNLLGGRGRDFHVPVTFSADALEYLMQTKGTIENGWWWVHPRLGAPSTFVEVA